MHATLDRRRGGHILYNVIQRAQLLVTMLVIAGLLASACTLTRRGGSDPVVVPATAIPTFVGTPRLPPTAEPTPTATPVTNLGGAQAELLVWTQIATCAAEIARSTGAAVDASFASTYTRESGTWLVEASSQDLRLRFGTWEVADGTGVVTPVDQVSNTIATPGVVCDQPEAFLAEHLTPPRLATVTPHPHSHS